MAGYEAQIKAKRAPDAFDLRALTSFGYRRTLLATGMPPLAAFAWLPVQLLHGDFHDRNLFFGADGSITGIIDWELAAHGPRAWEIIRALDVALNLPQDLASGGARLRAFLHGYAAEAPLTVEECQAMPDLYWVYRVHSLWVFEEHYRKGSARTDHLAMEDVPALEWWQRHRAAVATALIDALRSAPAVRLARAQE
jgi:Ser/Thr protein kinase RdoA (MazF antagonist)